MRLYHAYITTAPATVDAPSTMTLYESTVTDLAGFAIDPEGFDVCRPRTSARLVLIDALELAMVLEERYGVTLDDDPETNREVFASVRSLARFVSGQRVG